MLNNKGTTQSLVDVSDIREDTIIMKSGDLRRVILAGGMNFALKSEEDQTVITQQYRDFLNSVDFPLQVIIHSRKINIDKYLASLDQHITQETPGLLQNQIAEYKEFVKGFVQENPIMEKSFFVVVPFSPTVITTHKGFSFSFGFLGGKKKKGNKGPQQGGRAQIHTEGGVKPQDEREFKKSLQQLQQRVTQVTDGCRVIGLETKVLTTEELIELVYNFYNPETIEREGITVPQ